MSVIMGIMVGGGMIMQTYSINNWVVDCIHLQSRFDLMVFV
ncbi:MAG: hypothetical protein RMK94_02635 [Armatimonadota bacterium]|nr:hypothetical protein [Armatimonadota bacterium]